MVVGLVFSAVQVLKNDLVDRDRLISELELQLNAQKVSLRGVSSPF